VSGSRRVVITGVGLASPIGNSLDEVSLSLQSGRHGIKVMPEWAQIGNFNTRLNAEVTEFTLPDAPRKKLRTMGRVALLATYATEKAIAEAGLTEQDLQSGRVGLAHGSTHGSSSALEEFCRSLFKSTSMEGLAGSAYLKFMSHTTVANLAQFFSIRGRVVSTCAACVSASMAIGSGYELVKNGVQDVVIAGGAEEMHFVHAGVFDIMFATSTKYNDRPNLSPRPFDRDRDGLVIGEGAGTLILETYERASKRGAHIHGEILGYGANCDGTHVTSPSAEGMAACMQLALGDARIGADRIDYVNAHATATETGDIAESQATMTVLGDRVPVSSTKGNTGHTLGGCGAIEAAFCLAAMRDGFLPPSRNLDNVDPRCAALNFVMGSAHRAKPNVVMTNNFAFGGINTSLILARV
jgi:3-oxoacyl-[acyl-carrier-protein] synthase II